MKVYRIVVIVKDDEKPCKLSMNHIKDALEAAVDEAGVTVKVAKVEEIKN